VTYFMKKIGLFILALLAVTIVCAGGYISVKIAISLIGGIPGQEAATDIKIVVVGTVLFTMYMVLLAGIIKFIRWLIDRF